MGFLGFASSGFPPLAYSDSYSLANRRAIVAKLADAATASVRSVAGWASPADLSAGHRKWCP